MPRHRKGKPGPRSQRGAEPQEEVTPATREDIVALLDQFRFPRNRAVDDWPGVARALVRAARGFGLDVPHYLAWGAGFREPPAPLRVINGGKRNVEVVTDSMTNAPSASMDADDTIDADDLAWFEANLTDRTNDGGATILTGRHADALRVESSKKRPTD